MGRITCTCAVPAANGAGSVSTLWRVASMASSAHVLPDPFPRRVGEQLLNHLFYREETFFVVEGSSLRSAKATREAYACARLGSCLHLTILVPRPASVDLRASRRWRGGGGNAIDATLSPAQRHPVDRVISRYWFEGRWGLFKKPEKGSEIGFGDWLRQKRVIHAGHRNERLWSVTSELYTKTLAGAVQCINQIVAARLPRTRPTHWLICVQVLWWTKIYNSPSSTSKPRRSG